MLPHIKNLLVSQSSIIYIMQKIDISIVTIVYKNYNELVETLETIDAQSVKNHITIKKI